MSIKELKEFCEKNKKIAIMHSGQLRGFKGLDNDC